MEKIELEIGDVVQIDPTIDTVFGGQFMVITNLRTWGAQGYVPTLSHPVRLAYYRCRFKDMEYVGKATWVNKYDIENSEETK
jgi:hypothetical protein